MIGDLLLTCQGGTILRDVREIKIISRREPRPGGHMHVTSGGDYASIWST
jgi:hypothetical protein